MKPLQTTKIVPAILPAAIVDGAAFTSNVIDLNDFGGCAYIEFVGTIGSIDAEMALLRVMESDTKSDATTLGGTPAAVKAATTLPDGDDDNTAFVFGVDLRGPRERYLQIQATAGDGATGTFLSAIAIGRPGRETSDATPRGLLFAEYA